MKLQDSTLSNNGIGKMRACFDLTAIYSLAKNGYESAAVTGPRQ